MYALYEAGNDEPKNHTKRKDDFKETPIQFIHTNKQS